MFIFLLQVRGSQTEYLCTFFVEGVAIADARGRKRFLKQKENVQKLFSFYDAMNALNLNIFVDYNENFIFKY